MDSALLNAFLRRKRPMQRWANARGLFLSDFHSLTNLFFFIWPLYEKRGHNSTIRSHTDFTHCSAHGNMFLPNSSTLILFAVVAGTILLSSYCSASTAAVVSGGRPIHVLSDGEQATRALQSQASQLATEAICSICGNVGGPSKLKPEAIWDGTFSGFGMIPESSYNNTTCASIEVIANTLDPPSVNNTNEAIATSCLGIQSPAYIQCCDMAEWPTPVYECEQSVQEAWGDINSAIVPLPRVGGKLEVDASLLYFHLSELSTVQGMARVAIGVNLRWRDERLAWSPEEMGGCVSASTYASLDAEKTKIWIPDFDLINQMGGGLHSFSDRYAEVFANGEVNWFRYGGSFEAICGFTGLERFPYDTLECTMDFGSASEIPKIKCVQELSGPGLLITDVIGRSVINRIAPHYQEFTFIEDMSAFERLNDEMIRLKLYFRRSPRYYRMTVIIPTVLMTFLSFGQFVLDQRLGERLGFAVSLLLVMVAQSILTAELIPRCEELLWVKHVHQRFFVLYVLCGV